MKIARTLSAGLVLALLIGSRPAAADGWSLQKLNPFAKRVKYNTISGRRYNIRRVERSPLEKLSDGTNKFFAEANAGTKKFLTDADAGAKKFFTGARDALTWKKPAPKRRPTNQYIPWMRDPRTGRYAQYKPKQKSWLDSLLGRKEPKRVESFDDWWKLKRLDP